MLTMPKREMAVGNTFVRQAVQLKIHRSRYADKHRVQLLYHLTAVFGSERLLS